MLDPSISENAHTSRSFMLPSIPTQTLSAVHHMHHIEDEQQLRECLDRTLAADNNVYHLTDLMSHAISSNKVFLVKELLCREMPLTSWYVHKALEAKAKDILEIFFDHGWDINQPMGTMNPPILGNALEDWEMTIWLLDHGADPNARCHIDYTPLSHAVKYADPSIIDLLLRRDGDVTKGQLVHNAVWRESDAVKVVADLIDRGAPFNSLLYQDDQASWASSYFMAETPLHTAVAHGKVDLVHLLIGKGADVEIQDSKGRTVMQCADERLRREIVEAMQKGSVLHASL